MQINATRDKSRFFRINLNRVRNYWHKHCVTESHAELDYLFRLSEERLNMTKRVTIMRRNCSQEPLGNNESIIMRWPIFPDLKLVERIPAELDKESRVIKRQIWIAIDIWVWLIRCKFFIPLYVIDIIITIAIFFNSRIQMKQLFQKTPIIFWN